MCYCIAGAMAGGIFLLVKCVPDQTALSWLLGLISVLVLLSWGAVAYVVHVTGRMDEDDLYDGGDRAGVVIFVPAAFSLLWLVVCATVAASRILLGHQPIFTAALKRDAAAFAGATAFGVLVCCTVSLCAPRRQGMMTDD